MNRATSVKYPTRKNARQDAASPRVWGLDVRDAHDRRWATRGIEVVRCGADSLDEQGPGLYLLVDCDDLVTFRIRPLMRRMQWLRPVAMRVRVAAQRNQSYAERVRTDGNGEFHAIERDYRTSGRSTGRIALTTHVKVAELWRTSADSRSAWRAIRDRFGTDRTVVASVRGSINCADVSIESNRYAESMIRDWQNIGSALDGVYEFAPGVWFHESTVVSEHVTFSPPVWVGAGVSLRDGAAVVGPGVLPDENSESVEPGPVDWVAQVRTPGRSGRRFRSRRRRVRRVSKRLFDIVFALCVLAATLPLYPIVMFFIYIEDGRPFFFAHYRQTLRGREFPCYKFRTMIRDAEGMKAQLAAANQADGPQFFIEKDPRLLRIGGLLRRLQIDELPQFWNVLRGHMSVVGPRPSPDKENQYCPTWREARLSVRPGVTGLWQVRRTREPETDFQEWIRYDLEYVRRQSWRLDIWIILQTIKQVIGG